MYGIIQTNKEEVWYMIRGRAFTNRHTADYPIKRFQDIKDARICANHINLFTDRVVQVVEIKEKKGKRSET